MDNPLPLLKRAQRIVFFVGSIGERGGTERVATLIANGLSRRGYEVSIVSLWGGLTSAYALEPEISLHELFPKNRKFKWKYFEVVRGLRKYVKKRHADVVVSTDTLLILYSVPACVGRKVMKIAWEHFNFYADLDMKARKFARRLAGRMMDAIVVLTKEDLATWEKKVSGSARLTCIVNPITFPPIQLKERNWDNPVAIAVGRLTYQKGFDLLIRCWKQVAAVSPAWKLCIIGEGEDEPMLKTQIKSEGLEGVVSILPFNPHIAEYYLNASIFCLSSRFEGLPMVLLEAQAFALPSVCFNCYTGPTEVVTQEENGFILSPDDLPGFSDRIVELAGDPALRKRMGMAALKRAELYQQNHVLDRWEALLQS